MGFRGRADLFGGAVLCASCRKLYIREHASEQITTDDLVLVGGVSARSIYHGFSRFRSITPMGYLKAVRLDLARDALIKGRHAGANSVTQAATAAGYTNLSQFSRDYKAPPSANPVANTGRRVAGFHQGPRRPSHSGIASRLGILNVSHTAIFSRNLRSPSPLAITSRYWPTLNSRVWPSRSVWYTV